jgi:hypothetical protein
MLWMNVVAHNRVPPKRSEFLIFVLVSPLIRNRVASSLIEDYRLYLALVAKQKGRLPSAPSGTSRFENVNERPNVPIGQSACQLKDNADATKLLADAETDNDI